MTIEPIWIETALRLFGAVSTLATGLFAWLYFRERGGQLAQQRLAALQERADDLNAEIISRYETRVRLLLIEIEGLTKELQAAQHTLAEMRRQSELIG